MSSWNRVSSATGMMIVSQLFFFSVLVFVGFSEQAVAAEEKAAPRNYQFDGAISREVLENY